MVEKKSRRRASRAASSVFAAFDQRQVQEFKEAFNLIDQDRDGVIGFEDIKEVYTSLGRVPHDSDLKAMLNEAPGPINFATLLSMFGDKLSGTDAEDVILNAFKLLDEDGSGFLNTKDLRQILTSEGRNEERLTEVEFSQMLEGAPVDHKGMLDYENFARLIKRGKQEDE
ncbi:hypothetical protein GJ496_007931 [Pomphorhynchus laevis]|nr:hypothetical protein GJ496_007931 [Pomphorhynchus laevis]